MSEAYPETEESTAAREGTAAHEVASTMLLAGSVLPSSMFVGMPVSNGVVIDDEMYESAETYARDVLAIRAKYPDAHFGIEERVEGPRVHKELFGTPDAYLYAPEDNALYIWDFKHGYEVVEAYMNTQCIAYYACIRDKFKPSGFDDQTLDVHIRIIQPRAFHRDGPVRSWTTKGVQFRANINYMRTGALEALGDKGQGMEVPNPKTRSGTYCKHCTARHACPAALKAGLSMYEVVGKSTPVELSPEALGVQLAIVKRARKQLEYLESGFEEQAKSLIRSGSSVPGWRVETGYGREKWAKPADEIIALGDILGQELRKPPQAISPNQARKLGINDAVVTSYSETPKTGIKIIPDNGDKARQVFSK